MDEPPFAGLEVMALQVIYIYVFEEAEPFAGVGEPVGVFYARAPAVFEAE